MLHGIKSTFQSDSFRLHRTVWWSELSDLFRQLHLTASKLRWIIFKYYSDPNALRRCPQKDKHRNYGEDSLIDRLSDNIQRIRMSWLVGSPLNTATPFIIQQKRSPMPPSLCYLCHQHQPKVFPNSHRRICIRYPSQWPVSVCHPWTASPIRASP